MEGTHPLRQWRNQQGLSLKALAAALGVTKPTVSRWENHQREPSLTQAAKLSEKTGIPLDQFVRAEAAE